MIYVGSLGLSMFTNNLKLIKLAHRGLSFFSFLTLFVNNIYIKAIVLIFLILMMLTWKYCSKDGICLINLYTEKKFKLPKPKKTPLFRTATPAAIVAYAIQIVYMIYKKQNLNSETIKAVL